MEIPTTRNPRLEYFSCRACRSGMDLRQGAHHVAQKSSSTTLPARALFETGLPCRSVSENAGLSRGKTGGMKAAASVMNDSAHFSEQKPYSLPS